MPKEDGTREIEMSHEKKVIWAEGMFLRAQHFQQQEYFWESCSFRSVSSLNGFYWGFTHLKIDDIALQMGQLLIQRAEGILPDGTVFQIGQYHGMPVSYDIPASVKDTKICLVLPPARSDEENVIFEEDTASSARFLAESIEVHDSNEIGAGVAEIQVGRPRFRLMSQEDIPHGWVSLGIVWLIEKQTNNACRLDENYIPPTLHCGGNELLFAYLREAIALLNQRGDILAERISATSGRATSEIGDFLLLKIINYWQPLLRHLETLPVLHPERLYENLLALCGELAIFSAKSRRPTDLPAYVHDDLGSSFRPLMIELRQSLSLVLDQTVIKIDLRERKYGIKTALISDKTLLHKASFVLAVHANLPAEQIRAQFPTQTKIGPVEKIRDLVNLQLPGVVIKPLPVAPRELPYNAGYNYFEIDTQHVLWKDLGRSAGLALHVAGDFPGLELLFWAIRK